MAPPPAPSKLRTPPNSPTHRQALSRALALSQERRAQLRGLLLLAAAVLLFSLYRAGGLTLFHPGWWRLW